MGLRASLEGEHPEEGCAWVVPSPPICTPKHTPLTPLCPTLYPQRAQHPPSTQTERVC